MNRTLRIVIASLVVASTIYAETSVNDRFAQGNQFYEAKEYAKAAESYESIIADGAVSSAVYFNLANAYFKQGDLGLAILNYYRARRLDPSDQDIEDNLSFARQFTSIQMEGVRLNPITTFLENLVESYRLKFLAWIASLCFVLFMTLLILRVGLAMQNPIIRAFLVTGLVLTIVSAALTTFKYHTDYVVRRAVILEENCPVQTGPTDQSDIELQGAPGLVVEIVSQSGDYLNVLFENKRRGWIKQDFLAEI